MNFSQDIGIDKRDSPLSQDIGIDKLYKSNVFYPLTSFLPHFFNVEVMQFSVNSGKYRLMWYMQISNQEVKN